MENRTLKEMFYFNESLEIVLTVLFKRVTMELIQ